MGGLDEQRAVLVDAAADDTAAGVLGYGHRLARNQ